MSKKSKIVAGLMVCIMAISLMCFGFSQWSSDITLNGSVSAKGNWDVKVTDASIQLSTGAALAESEEASTYEVVVYPVYVDYKNNYYYYRVDDVNTKTVSVTADELAAYDTSMGVSTFVSGEASGDYTFRLNKADGVDGMVANWYNRASLKAADGGALDGQCIGEAIAWCYKGFATNTPANSNVVLNYADAKSYLAENPTTSVTAETTFTDDTVNYAAVNFSMPGAWAQYSVTITNNGSAAANLSDYAVETSALDAEVYAIDVPDLSGDVIAAGDSCTFTVVVKVLDDVDELDTEAQPFSIELVYNAPTVEAAPEATHSAH